MQVTKHSALRYAQRVMGMDVEVLTSKQLSAIKQKIFDVVIPIKDYVRTLGDCEIGLGEFTYVFYAGRLVTIKHPDTSVASAFKGGHARGGTKLKKRKNKKSKYERENYVNINR